MPQLLRPQGRVGRRLQGLVRLGVLLGLLRDALPQQVPPQHLLLGGHRRVPVRQHPGGLVALCVALRRQGPLRLLEGGDPGLGAGAGLGQGGRRGGDLGLAVLPQRGLLGGGRLGELGGGLGPCDALRCQSGLRPAIRLLERRGFGPGLLRVQGMALPLRVELVPLRLEVPRDPLGGQLGVAPGRRRPPLDLRHAVHACPAQLRLRRPRLRALLAQRVGHLPRPGRRRLDLRPQAGVLGLHGLPAGRFGSQRRGLLRRGRRQLGLPLADLLQRLGLGLRPRRCHRRLDGRGLLGALSPLGRFQLILRLLGGRLRLGLGCGRRFFLGGPGGLFRRLGPLLEQGELLRHRLRLLLRLEASRVRCSRSRRLRRRSLRRRSLVCHPLLLLELGLRSLRVVVVSRRSPLRVLQLGVFHV